MAANQKKHLPGLHASLRMAQGILRTLFTIAVFTCLAKFSSAQPTPPGLRCIEVETSGEVTLTWVEPADTGAVFGGYFVFSSLSAAGPFAPADSIFSYSTLSTTITGINANNTVIYFFLKTREGSSNTYSVPSDTLRSMRMIVTPLSNEAVRLNWNRIHTPPLPTTLPAYVVSKELTTGTFTTFRTLPDTTTNDTNIYCNKFINYRVIQGDASGCQSVSSIDGELFRDTKGPAKPLLDTVSIDQLTGDVSVSWFPDSSLDTDGYVIYMFNGISYDSIGTVYGINNTYFVNTASLATSTVEIYTVAAFDSCKNLGPIAENHQTIFLNSTFEQCGALVTLNWTNYVNFKNGLSRYEIWYRENGGPWNLDNFVPPTVLDYEFTLTQPGVTYEFLIRAVGNLGQTSTSNIIQQVADIFDQPDFLYIRSLDVSGNSVLVSCYADANADLTGYKLYRSLTASGPFTLVTTKPYVPSNDFTITDTQSGASNSKVFYKFTAVDSCGLEMQTSNTAGTVFLMAEGGNDFTSDLSWLDYSGWQGPTGFFLIYRSVNGIISGAPIAIVSGDTLSYTEDISEANIPGNNICYIVRAVEDSLNSFGFKDSSRSNEACAPQAPSVFIPNAFTPGGKNPVFKPVILYGDPATYELKIFNRWGQSVYESSNPEEGWNGTYQGSDALSGVYAYLLIFNGYNRKEVRRTGTVMLLR